MRRGAYRDSGPIGLSQFDDTIITNHSQHLNEEPSSPKDYNLNYRCINFMEGNYKSQGTVGSGVSAVEGARVTEQVIGAVAGAGRPSIASSPTPAPTEPRASPPASSGAASKHAAGAIARSFAEVASAEGKWSVPVVRYTTFEKSQVQKSKIYWTPSSADYEDLQHQIFRPGEWRQQGTLTPLHRTGERNTYEGQEVRKTLMDYFNTTGKVCFQDKMVEIVMERRE
ncbi:unnamed protein product [Parnassius apollo]|uniref:(apollo) hypothetical protein n=1 Tax=Parnassius apollo TaxID=110799 RepID=A0A8S3WHS7_PARAO|nr:unnamed protein product [Parnassius apollo]